MPLGSPPAQLNAVKLVSVNGYARSAGGQPWEAAATSIYKTETLTGGVPGTPTKDQFRQSLRSEPSWGSLLFRSTYTQSYATHDREQAKLLNHERLTLHGGHRGGDASIMLPGGKVATSLENSLSRMPVEPFGGLSQTVWRR